MDYIRDVDKLTDGTAFKFPDIVFTIDKAKNNLNNMGYHDFGPESKYEPTASEKLFAFFIITIPLTLIGFGLVMVIYKLFI